MGVQTAYVTLHVGAGTFQPVRVEDIAEHHMHSEWYTMPQATVDAIRLARARGGRVMAVGTTSLRALESAAAGGELEAGCGETNIFILPGYRFKVVERLITNFHLPKSTLLMLVSAFGGMDNIRRAYRHAVEKRYRFFSYGDAMLIERQPMKFDLLATDGAARRGSSTLAHGTGRDPGLHAGGHLRHGEGDVARRAEGHRRPDRARQHLPPVAAPRAGGDRGARRAAPLHGLGRADPHRLAAASRCSAWASCARSPRRA